MKYKLYESYGLIAHEKKPIYSDTIPATEHYNIVTVEMPFPLSENAMGETLVEIDGQVYLLSEVLSNFGDAPCIIWYDGHNNRRVMLDVL